MLKIFKIKTLLFTPLIKWVVLNPGVMKSNLFLKAMITFPSMVSKTYDKKIAGSGHDYHRALEQGLTRVFNKPQKILDLCTGTGIAAFKVAAAFPMSSIDAIDQIRGMLDVAKKKAEESGITNINFEIGNAAKLKYSENEFDFIVTSNAPIYLSEAARVLKSGGLFLATYSFSGDAFLHLKYAVNQYLSNNGIDLVEMESTGNGVYILGQKNK